VQGHPTNHERTRAGWNWLRNACAILVLQAFDGQSIPDVDFAVETPRPFERRDCRTSMLFTESHLGWRKEAYFDAALQHLGDFK
jgi:hypothetical protein